MSKPTPSLMATDPAPAADRMLRLPEVMGRTGCGKTTIYKLMRESKFPQCIRITSRLSVWPESAISTWIADRIQKGGV